MMIVEDYPRFCLADPDFFERPELLSDEAERFAASGLNAPKGWRRTEADWWVQLRPAHTVLPQQGWFIHVSVGLEEIEKAVEIVWGYCVDRGIPFDFIRSTTTARHLNGDDADRFRSGKLINVYAIDDTVLADALSGLSVLLDGMAGPRVLGALVHGDGPLQVCHTAFDGHSRSTSAVFTPPPGVALPEVLAEDLAALRTRPADDFPYRVISALRLSNGGGAYLAQRSSHNGDRVVLKEARPHAGLDRRGQDAVTRLARERQNLDQLAGLDCVPGAAAYRIVAGHHFLEQEYIAGTSLFASIMDLPLTSETNAAREAAGYTTWALAVLEQLDRALRDIHARGLRLGELKPQNVIVRPDGRVVIVDLESATELDDDRAPAHGEPGFTVPAGLSGTQAHEYLLNCMRVALFLPVDHKDPAKLPTIVGAIRRHYPVPPGFGERVLAGLLPHGRPERADVAGALLAAGPPRWERIRDSLIRGIHLMATPERSDRLFPCTPTGPRMLGGYTLGYGAAGVLYALHTAGAEIPDDYVRWLVDAVLRDEDPQPGLYDGLHGAAYTLDLLDRREEALAILDRCLPIERTSCPDLFGGRAGIALNLLHFATVTGDRRFEDRALRLAEELGREGPLAARPGQYEPIGLLHGTTGIAALFCRLHRLTGETRYLDLAERAMEHDLARCTTSPDGTVLLRHPTTVLPYLHGGSWGLAFVLPYLLHHRPDDAKAALLAGIHRACRLIYVRFPGLLRGRAGAIAALAVSGDPADRQVLDTQLHRLSWHAQTYRGELAFPGLRMPRLSTDLATGSSGVLLALAAVFDRTPVLPHLDPRPPVLTETRRR
ncbi:class III lanthionine synthetase LanKC [Streptomyces sp. NPDC055210]